jgi:biopolymer transport protein ExbB/TolQ
MFLAKFRRVAAALVPLAVAVAGAAAAQTPDAPVRVGSLTPALVFVNAAPFVKAIMLGLTVAGIAAVVVTVLRLSQGRRGAGAYVSGTAQAAPLAGLLGAVYGLLNAALGLSNVRPVPSLTVVAPGLAEALLTFGLGLMVAVVAVICRWILEGRRAPTRAS